MESHVNLVEESYPTRILKDMGNLPGNFNERFRMTINTCGGHFLRRNKLETVLFISRSWGKGGFEAFLIRPVIIAQGTSKDLWKRTF